MLEKVGHVRNPLTIIAIFAGFAEVSGTLILPFINPSVQSTYVWFLMGFPILLVLLFFFVLYTKHKVLYAPSDYRSDDPFVNLSKKEVSSDYEENVRLLVTDNVKENIENVTNDLTTDSKDIEKTAESISVYIGSYNSILNDNNKRTNYYYISESYLHLIQSVFFKLGVSVKVPEIDRGADLVIYKKYDYGEKVLPIEVKFYQKQVTGGFFTENLIESMKKLMDSYNTDESILFISSDISDDLKPSFSKNGIHIVTGTDEKNLTSQLESIL